jgi:diacylglycerol kinase family enzyme
VLWGAVPFAVAGLTLKKGTLIYNPVAGGRPAWREREVRVAVAVLHKAGLEIELAPTTGPAMAHELAQAAIAGSADVVLACGGDGTINEIVNGLAGSYVPLGILPGGTANILARELRLPLSPLGAARQFTSWTPRRIALGRARWAQAPSAPPGVFPTETGCRYYISVAGIGYDAHIVYKLSPWLKSNLGVTGYVLEALRRLITYNFPQFAFRVGDEERQATFAVVQRTRLYAGWLHLTPTAGLFHPRFAVCSFPSRSRLRYLLYAAAVFARQHLHLADVSLDHCTKLVCAPVDPTATIHFELDGELAGMLPANFEIVPDALTILAPPGAGG